MCRIYVLFDFYHPDAPLVSLLDRMGAVVEHRGPDDRGRYLGRGVALGMHRLSIIDVARGHQPISNEDESIWVVQNGEIYNFQELRTQLEQRGHKFRTRTDTEVLVHLYEQEGPSFLTRLRGMFALALWDLKRERLILARDRVGEKPLYIRREPNRLLFASELKSILQVQDMPRRLDVLALREYLTLGYVPAPSSMIEGIEKLLPGHYLLIEKGRIEDHEYWDVPFGQSETHSEQEWLERIREKLLETIKL